MNRVLLVDDDPDLRFLTEMALNESGYEVTSASDGKQAISLAHSQPFDLILLDALMPEMDGYEVHRILKADPDTQAIPVIFLTAQMPSQPGLDYIPKPYDPDRIGQQIKDLLQKIKR